MAIPANTTYLEAFVESVGSLPSELQRLLNTIKEIDDRTQTLLASVRDRTDFCLQLPSQSSRKATPDQISEVVKVRDEIEKEQSLITQLANEKVQLASQCWEMVDGHLHRLNEQLGNFEGELQAQEKDAFLEPSPTGIDTAPMVDWDREARIEKEREREREEEEGANPPPTAPAAAVSPAAAPPAGGAPRAPGTREETREAAP